MTTRGHDLLNERLDASTSSRTDIARDLGMSLQTLSNIARRGRLPTLPQAVAMEDFLAIPVRSWFGKGDGAGRAE